MGIKWLDKSHRSPVSCKEINREQVANRSRSQCKQGLSDSEIKNSVGCIGACAFLLNAFANISQTRKKIKMILTAIWYYKSKVFCWWDMLGEI